MGEKTQENLGMGYSAAYPTGRELAGNFSDNLFWDADCSGLDLVKNRRYVVQRVLERGTISDMKFIFGAYGLSDVVATAKGLRSLDPKALSLIACQRSVLARFFLLSSFTTQCSISTGITPLTPSSTHF